MSRKEKEKNICLSTLKSRGWTQSLIDKLLPPPKLVRNPYYSSAPEMKTWPLSVVEAAETDPLFTEMFQKKQVRKKKRQENHDAMIATISDVLQSQNPADAYPEARAIKRHFIIEVGETNTGKTYEALEALKQSKKGVYLAPLRLLAMEVQDTLLSCGVSCSMLTGEESNIVPGAQHMSSTVEMLNLSADYDVGVIDECQLLADPERGGSWTRAILGLCAPTIYLCTPPHVVKICQKLIDLCGDTYEIRTKERKVPLEFIGHIKLKDLQKGDAVILFSRKGVLSMAEKIRKNTVLTVGTIYGALPYQSRKEQVDRFRNGDTDVIVSTDAIGMGMNLPIRRVVFAQTEKFNGYNVAPLSEETVKQIAGRAGRYGMYDTGYVAVLNDCRNSKCVKDGLKNSIAAYCRMYVPFPEKMLSVKQWPSVENCIKTWLDVPYPDCFRKTDMSNVLYKATYVRKKYPDMTQEQIYRLSTVPFDFDNDVLRSTWAGFISKLVHGGKASVHCNKKELQNNLEYAEGLYKQLDLCYSFCRITGLEMDMTQEEFESVKELVVESINSLLLHGQPRKES